GGLPKCPFSGPDECRYSVLAWFAGDDTYEFSQTSFDILVRQFDTEIAVLNVAGNQGDEVILSATLTKQDDNSPIEGKTLNFYVNGAFVGSSITNAEGIATLAYTILRPRENIPSLQNLKVKDVSVVQKVKVNWMLNFLEL
ncbi:MAG: Ig-like domain-containing protein, partial [Methanobacterium sp.]|nr:Ig-like domain-containing protein [Methanobacterium sp.]